jgi:hypothetical protein
MGKNKLQMWWWELRAGVFRNRLRIWWWEFRNGPAVGPLDKLRSIGVDEKVIQKFKDDKNFPEVQ